MPDLDDYQIQAAYVQDTENKLKEMHDLLDLGDLFAATEARLRHLQYKLDKPFGNAEIMYMATSVSKKLRNLLMKIKLHQQIAELLERLNLELSAELWLAEEKEMKEHIRILHKLIGETTHLLKGLKSPNPYLDHLKQSVKELEMRRQQIHEALNLMKNPRVTER